MKITRRDFLCKTAVFTAAATLPPALFHPLKSFAAPQPKATIAAVTGNRVDAVKKAVSMIGGMEMFVKKGSRVCLKPNMSFPHEPDRATNTHPEVVATVARLCIDAGAAEVIIIDYPFNPPEKCLKLSGIADACKGIKNTHAFVIYDENLFQTRCHKKRQRAERGKAHQRRAAQRCDHKPANGQVPLHHRRQPWHERAHGTYLGPQVFPCIG